MNQESQKKTPEQVVEAIFALNLDPIKQKLMDKTEGHGWTRRQAEHNELEYKRFLVLLAKYPDQPLAPATEVRKFWHGHILDTKKYAEDCDKVFGSFMHHCPYRGMRGEDDAAALVNAFMNMQRLRDCEFGHAKQAVAGKTSLCAAASGKAVNAAGEKSAWCTAVSGGMLDAPAHSAAFSHAAPGGRRENTGRNAAWRAAAAVSQDVVGSSFALRPILSGNETSA